MTRISFQRNYQNLIISISDAIGNIINHFQFVSRNRIPKSRNSIL